MESKYLIDSSPSFSYSLHKRVREKCSRASRIGDYYHLDSLHSVANILSKKQKSQLNQQDVVGE